MTHCRLSQEDLQALSGGDVPAGYELVTFPESRRRGLLKREDATLVNFGPLFEQHGMMTFVVPTTKETQSA